MGNALLTSFFGPAPILAITREGLALVLEHAKRFADIGAAAGVGGARRPTLTDPPGVRRIQIIGPISHRATFFGQLFGWPSVTSVRSQLDEAVADPTVETILLELDSPGGSVFGIEELAEAIRAGRSQKRVVAYAAPLAASAAYWIGAAATEFYGMPSGEVGSVGVIAIHFDESRAWDAAGITPTILTTAPYKSDGNSFEPLSAEAKAYFLDMMGSYHRKFVGSIAKFRGVSPAQVESNFGRGRTVLAAQAVSLGMIDGLAVGLGDALARRPGQRRASAAHARRLQQGEADIAEARLRAS